MPWIESHTVLIRHRKVVDGAAMLGMPPAHFLGHLHALWHAALDQQEDGNLIKWSDAFIASAAGFTGKPDAFVRALRKAHWIDGKRLHDWLDYAGRFLESRYHTADPARLVSIWKVHGKAYTLSPAQSLKVASSQTKGIPPTVPYRPDLPNPTDQNGTADKSVNNGRSSGKAQIAELAILSKPWHFKGEHHMKRTGDLPPDYCQWAIRNLVKLSAEERLACEIVISRAKKLEAARPA